MTLSKHFYQQTLYFLAIPLLLLVIGLGYFTPRTHFFQMIGLYGGLFGLYIWIVQNVVNRQMIWFFVGVGLLMRFALIFSMPNLSDDVYRFIWDGRLWLSGLNPFDALPTTYIEQNNLSPLLTQALYEKLNSPNYFTIYPPICQAIFVLGCWGYPQDILGSVIIIKLLLFVFEIGTFFLLITLFQRLQIPLQRILWYALNPLIIMEIIGNMHFEGVMIFFLVLAFYLLITQKWIASAFAFAFAIATKLLPIMFLPFLFWRLGWKRSLQYYLIVGGVTLILFVPLFSPAFIVNFGESLNLYFQKFEFNASLYYIGRWIGYQQIGYNMIRVIGPGLAVFTGLSILGIAFFKKETNHANLPHYWLLAITIYLFCTTTVHPWYTALPIVLCLFTPFRYPMFWSGFIFFTYINYSYAEYFENLWIVGLEYWIVLGCIIYELANLKTLPLPQKHI